MQHAEAEILKVRHAKGTPNDGAKAMIQSFRTPIARSTSEVVGDFAKPIA